MPCCLDALQGHHPASNPIVAAPLPATQWHQPTAQRRRRQASQEGFKACPIGFFHIDIAEVQTAEGKLYLFVGIDRTSQFAYVQLVEQATRVTASPSSRPFPTDPHRPNRQRHPVPLRSSIRVGAQTF